MTEALHLAAGHVPMGVWLAVAEAQKCLYTVDVWLPGRRSGHRYAKSRTQIRCWVSKDESPELVDQLKSVGFRWAGSFWRWEAR